MDFHEGLLNHLSEVFLERKLWLDNVRSLACIMVVIVHVTVLYKGEFGRIDNFSWYITTSLDSISRMCVPLFFMVSGFLFLHCKEVKRKNIVRVFTALTFYSLLASLYYSVFSNHDLLESMFSIYKKPEMYHLWFFFYLFTFYMIFKIVTIRDISNKTIILIIVALFTIFNYKLNDIFSLFGMTFENGFYIRSDYANNFLYCIAGAVIGRSNYYKGNAILLFSLSILSVFFTILFTVIKSSEIGRFDAIFQTYTSIPVFFSAVTMFAFIKNVNFPPKIQKISSFIAVNSLSIYGVHAIYLEIIRKKHLYIMDIPVANLFITFSIVMILSVITSIMIRKFDKNNYVS